MYKRQLHACPLRVRPILMTTLTTVIAMIPMALGIGETNEMMTDMGVTMISGMVISTVITPVSYTHLDVYKRQGMPCPRAMRPRPPAPMRI